MNQYRSSKKLGLIKSLSIDRCRLLSLICVFVCVFGYKFDSRLSARERRIEVEERECPVTDLSNVLALFFL